MTNASAISVGGLTRFSTIDFPGRVSAVVFCRGCPWRCSYCYDKHLQSTPQQSPQYPTLPWAEVLDWLDTRRGLLEAVVFSGGEPLLQPGLAKAMYQVYTLGYRVGLHTAGNYPDRLAGVLPLVDWIGFDVKAPFDDYPKVTENGKGAKAQRALSFVLASGKPHEIRCTFDETRLSVNDAARMAEQLAEEGVSHLVLQEKRSADGTSTPINPLVVDAMTPWLSQVTQR